LRAIGELVGGIAHEFQQSAPPPILLNSDLLHAEWGTYPVCANDLKNDRRRRPAARPISRAGFLAFGRRANTRPEVLDLRAVVQANTDLVPPYVRPPHPAQGRRGRPGLPPLFLNSGDLHQILLNLLVNARDTLTEKLATRLRPTGAPAFCLEATLRPATAAVPLAPGKHPPPPSGIRLTVRETGGMTPAVMERSSSLFIPQANRAGHRLGLPPSGTIVAEIQRPDRRRIHPRAKATAFHLYLPPVVVPPRLGPDRFIRSGSALPRHPQTPQAAPREDEEPVSRIRHRPASARGHTVVSPPDGHRRLQQLSAAPAEFERW